MCEQHASATSELWQEIERKLQALYEMRVRLSEEEDKEQAKAEPPLPTKRRVRQAEVGVGAPQLGTLRTGRSVAYGSLDSRSEKPEVAEETATSKERKEHLPKREKREKTATVSPLLRNPFRCPV